MSRVDWPNMRDNPLPESLLYSDDDEIIVLERAVIVSVGADSTTVKYDRQVLNTTALARTGYNAEKDKDGNYVIFEREQPPPNARVPRGQPGNDTPPRLVELVRHVQRFYNANKDLLQDDMWMTSLAHFHTASPLREAAWRKDSSNSSAFFSALEVTPVIYIDMPAIVQRLYGRSVRPINVLETCGVHAREWEAQKCFFQFVRMLLENVQAVLRNQVGDLEEIGIEPYRFLLVPVVNVYGFYKTKHQTPTRHSMSGLRGYAAGHYDERYMRKADNEDADPNRNYDYFHGLMRGTSADPGSEVYCGPFPGSSVEAAAIMQMVGSDPRLRPNYSCDNHSYGNIFLRPPSFGMNDLMSKLSSRTNGFDIQQVRKLAVAPTQEESREMRHMRQTALTRLALTPERKEMLSDLFRELEQLMPGFRDDQDQLGYHSTGTLLDYMVVVHGAIGGGIEIGSQDSSFASESPEGWVAQCAVPRQMLAMFKAGWFQQLVYKWMTSMETDPNKDVMETWRGPDVFRTATPLVVDV